MPSSCSVFTCVVLQRIVLVRSMSHSSSAVTHLRNLMSNELVSTMFSRVRHTRHSHFHAFTSSLNDDAVISFSSTEANPIETDLIQVYSIERKALKPNSTQFNRIQLSRIGFNSAA